MSVKLAPAPGTVIEETKRTRTIPANSPENDGEKPWRTLGTWDYIASLSPEQWQKENLVIYLYRYDEKGNPWGIGKWTGPLDEFKVMEMFGGGRFNLKMKRGPMLIINDDFQLEGVSKTPGVNGAPAIGSTGAASGSEGALLTTINALIEELRASRGGTVAQEAMRQAMTINGQVFSAGVEAVKSTLSAPAGPTAPNPMDEMNRQLMGAVIQKILNPADPIENFAKMMLAMKGLPGFSMGGGGDRAGIALELVRQVPQVAQTLVQGVQAWQMAEEARARQAALLRGGSPAIPVTPVAHAATPPNVVQMPAAPPPADGAPPPAPPFHVEVPQMPLETLEQMLCNIIADTNNTVEEAATEACALIERSMPGMTDKMISQGEDFLLGLFQTRPVLQQVANHPRLAEFVKKFIETVKAAPLMQPVNPAAPVA